MLPIQKINRAPYNGSNVRTFLLVLVYVHLSLLLEAKRVDDGDGQPQRFSHVAVRSQGVDASARRRDVVCAL